MNEQQWIHGMRTGKWRCYKAVLRRGCEKIIEWKLWNSTKVNQFEKSLKLVLFLIFCFIKKKTRQSTQAAKRSDFKFHCFNICSENKLPFVIQVTQKRQIVPLPISTLTTYRKSVICPRTYLTGRRSWSGVCGSCWLWMTCSGGCSTYPAL